jgi:hypothetical protein
MLTLKQCREKLKNNGGEFTDEQALAIRDFLYKLGRINIDYIKFKFKQNEQKGNSVHPGLDR